MPDGNGARAGDQHSTFSIQHFPMHTPSRRQVLELAVAVGVGAGSSFAEAPHDATPPRGAEASVGPPLESFLPRVRDLREQFRARVAAWVRDDRLVRPDGFVYAVDVAQLMACFADAGERDGYETLRARAVGRLVVDDRSDPYTRGFVVWRRNAADDSSPPDASGTTEALRLAKALWRGAAAFEAPADRELALTILRGYARHATIDHGVWMVRNYFGFGTRSFASNSFLVDYDPDFVREVATEVADTELADVARRSTALVRGAVTPSGLLYDLVQPELKTMYPLLAEAVVTFSPNDVVQLSNAATVALTVTSAAPDVARRVLGFATDRLPGGRMAAAAGGGGGPALRMYHYGRTGEAVNDTRPGINEWSTLVRLACRLGDRPAAASLLNDAVAAWDYYLDHTPATEADAFVASEALAGMSALLAM
jgi:hypothetical protein